MGMDKPQKVKDVNSKVNIILILNLTLPPTTQKNIEENIYSSTKITVLTGAQNDCMYNLVAFCSVTTPLNNYSIRNLNYRSQTSECLPDNKLQIHYQHLAQKKLVCLSSTRSMKKTPNKNQKVSALKKKQNKTK